MAFTVLDVLGYLDEIPVCVAYEIDGVETTEFPVTHLQESEARLEKLPGWKCEIRGIKNYEELPENCRNYIEFIEAQIGCPDHHGIKRSRKRGYHLPQVSAVIRMDQLRIRGLENYNMKINTVIFDIGGVMVGLGRMRFFQQFGYPRGSASGS